MIRFALTLVVGLMLSVSGSAWGGILPDEPPDEQYKFALGKAFQNDLEIAEKAFAEWWEINKGHSREADAKFWLGRVQLMREKYKESATTFAEFYALYPNDVRLVDTTMWIAEAVHGSESIPPASSLTKNT